jgi:DNA-binding NarL/FixJ family response regulator
MRAPTKRASLQASFAGWHCAHFSSKTTAVIRENLIPTLEALSQARIEGVAESEAEAIAWLNSHEEWDVAVVDLFLREGSGLNVIAWCSGRKANQRVVIFRTTQLKRSVAARSTWALTLFSTSQPR